MKGLISMFRELRSLGSGTSGASGRVAAYELADDLLVLLNAVGWAGAVIRLWEGNLLQMGVFLALSVTASAVGIFLHRPAIRTAAVCGGTVKKQLRKHLFVRLFRAGPQYVDRKRSGEIITTLCEKVEWLSFYYTEYLPKSIAALLMSVGVIAWCFTRFAPAGIVLLLATICVQIIPPLFYPLVQRAGKREWLASDAFFADSLDGIRGIATLKAFHANERHREKVERRAEELRRCTMSSLVYTTLNSRAMDLALQCGRYLPFLLALPGAVRGEVSIPHLVMLFFVLGAWKISSEKTMGAWLKAGKGISGIQELAELLRRDMQQTPILPAVAQHGSCQPLAGDVVLEHITFSYAGTDHAVLRDLSLSIKEGTTTALIGPSGAGKSTVAQMLFGFYVPQIGTVHIGDTELREDTVSQFRSSIAAVWQDCRIFHTTCLDNIRMARQDATDEEVYEAARRARIHEFIIDLPDGYQTVIGDGGLPLSGGEQQRIAIARAFLKDSPVLIWDEATSAIDRHNEAEIYESLRELGRGKTVLVIAHRLQTIENANQICLMRHGSIQKQGTHHELMETSEEYRELVRAQRVEAGGTA